MLEKMIEKNNANFITLKKNRDDAMLIDNN